MFQALEVTVTLVAKFSCDRQPLSVLMMSKLLWMVYSSSPLKECEIESVFASFAFCINSLIVLTVFSAFPLLRGYSGEQGAFSYTLGWQADIWVFINF